jgi:hypothetical protein
MRVSTRSRGCNYRANHGTELEARADDARSEVERARADTERERDELTGQLEDTAGRQRRRCSGSTTRPPRTPQKPSGCALTVSVSGTSCGRRCRQRLIIGRAATGLDVR